MKYPFYQLYSFWIAVLFILYVIKIINFSIMPSVLIGIIGTIIILTYKFYITTFQINYKLGFTILIIHFIPLFVIPFKFTQYDLLYNLCIFIIYLLTLQLQNTNLIKVYNKIIYEQKTNASFYEYGKNLGFL